MQLYSYQVKGSTFLKTHKYVLLGDEMGLGKSFQAIDALPHRRAKLIVCPAMLRNTWVNEITKYCASYDWEPQVEVIRTAKHKFTWTGDRIFIISYELLKIFPTDIVLEAIIFDECHYLKSLGASRTSLAHRIVVATKPEFLFLLSGTPIKNNANEFYSVLKMLSYCPTDTNGKKVTEKSQYAFNLRFSHPSTRIIYTSKGKSIEVTEFKGLRNKDRLLDYLKNKYIRRLASKVLDIPPIIDKEVVLHSTPKPYHAQLKEAYCAFTDGDSQKKEHIMEVKIRNAREKVSSTVRYTLDLLENEEKVVVYSDHIEPAMLIYKSLLDKKVNVRHIDGGVPGAMRDKIIDDFQDDKVDVLVLTIQSCKEGITLTAARHMVFNDISWSYVDLQQARKRIHRVGQSSTCFIHYILSSDTDAWLKRKVLEKKRNLDEVL